MKNGIMTWTLLHLATLTLACSGVTSPEKDDKTSDTSSSEGADSGSDSEGADEPAWVNSMYLTCNWNSIESDSEAGVYCGVADKDGQQDPDLQQDDWQVRDGADKKVSASWRKKDDGRVVVMKAKEISGRSAYVVVTDGSYHKPLYAAFSALPGMSDGRLQACFNSEIAVGDCFSMLGIKVATGDVLTGNAAKKRTPACDRKDDLPAGVHCQIVSDGMIGDLDQAREWFQYGNSILGADGKVKADDYCDAGGIKAKSAQHGTISQTTRFFPYWDQGKRSCYEGFIPKELSEPSLSGAHVLFDPAHGVNGEPYCFFILIDEVTIFGGGMLRMHILKNPKLFPDSANDKAMTAETLKATADYFSCSKLP